MRENAVKENMTWIRKRPRLGNRVHATISYNMLQKKPYEKGYW